MNILLPNILIFMGIDTGLERSLHITENIYHIINVMNDIAEKNNIQIGYYNRDNILRVFQLLDRVPPEVNNFGRKRLISVNFVNKQLFDILGIEYKIIPLTRSKITLKYYEDWCERVYDLI